MYQDFWLFGVFNVIPAARYMIADANSEKTTFSFSLIIKNVVLTTKLAIYLFIAVSDKSVDLHLFEILVIYLVSTMIALNKLAS